MMASMAAEAGVLAGQYIATVVMAVALGMDAFSLGLGIGMKGIRLPDVLKISSVVGVFHIIMPLLGMYTGGYASLLLGHVAVLCGGAILVIIGAHMLYSSLRGDHITYLYQHTWFGIFLFALTVSIDSFSAGISLGLFGADMLLTVLVFGLFGGIMSICGLLLGRRFNGIFGDYGEAVGGLILIVFGFKFLW